MLFRGVLRRLPSLQTVLAQCNHVSTTASSTASLIKIILSFLVVTHTTASAHSVVWETSTEHSKASRQLDDLWNLTLCFWQRNPWRDDVSGRAHQNCNSGSNDNTCLSDYVPCVLRTQSAPLKRDATTFCALTTSDATVSIRRYCACAGHPAPYTNRDSAILNRIYVGVQCPTHFQKWGPMTGSWLHTTIKFCVPFFGRWYKPMISVCPQHETDMPNYMACSKSGICSSGLSSKQTTHKNMSEKLPMCRPIKLTWKIQDKRS
jgi:hypothetical protein